MISHWALIIDSPICADGQTKSRQSLGCDLRVAAAPTAGSSRYLLELKVVPRRGHKSISLSTVNIEGNTFENSSTESRQKWEPLQAAVLLGYTSYFNEEIHRKAERVIDSMASDYNAVSNNCQTFCTRLFTCIGIPNTEDEILSEIWTVPTSLQAEVELRRCIDYLVTRLLDLYANHARMAPSTIPMAINSLIKTALIIMTILALFLSFLLDTRLYYFLSLLSLAWGFYGRFNTMLIGSQHIPRPAWTDELLETTASMLFPSEIETDAQLHGIGTRDVW
ncbi:hypothetical protein M406DRAFT_357291 [Cryphonectria parasitica EP155]|uniref:PPPDE domain-containing protein n=1 Tax=Cryphonectria parasitica (strain ATCC 38755 / EP155) TaxID=660469 RepID=A0A9P4XZK9_CRYP1|nr:uncharacterized protein M406DRAFT_357291 [Cryphonectria parasitica EP155]KAF3763918.1 hypothetical protein M406DRAFT_357291 [Cryphonectria parasitica EP155]